MATTKTPGTEKPGADWSEARSTLDPRRRTRAQKRANAIVAATTLAVGLGAFYALDGTRAAQEPLAFRLEERPLPFVHEKGRFAPFFDNVLPFMQAVSASGCVGDVDRDGLLDVYLTTSGHGKPNALFRNEGAFRFAPWPTGVIEDLNRDGFSSDCTFADVDDDGFVDLFVGAVAQRPRLFKNVEGRTFVDVTEQSGVPAYMNGFAVAFLDVERDGDLDLLVSSYFGETYKAEDIPERPRIHTTVVPAHENAGRMLPNDWGDATNGGEKRFLLNDGAGRFVEQDAAAWGLVDERFTFDIGTADVNQDGFTDAYFANDFGPDQLFLNDGGERFVAVKGAFPTDVGRDSFKGMNADLADVDHDGFPEIYVTNVFHPVLPEGNILWHNRPHPSGDPFLRDFANVAADVGVKDGGWGWGAKFVDLDLDGDTDIVATNGYISQHPDREYWYRLSRLVAGDRRLIVDSRKWPPFEDRSMSGHQVSRVFVNEGARFYDRAADAGVTKKFDGRGVVVADFDVDGRPDVLFVPQGAPVQLLRNAPVGPSKRFVGVVVEGDGERVARSCVGCSVVVRPPAGPPTYREVSAGNGMTGQSMPWILVGLGDHPKDVDVDVEVRWTDGTRETLRLAPDRYHRVVKTVKTAEVTK